MNYNRRQNRTS